MVHWSKVRCDAARRLLRACRRQFYLEADFREARRSHKSGCCELWLGGLIIAAALCRNKRSGSSADGKST